MPVKIKRIYTDAAPGDGFRVLVDRLWPRGVPKDAGLMDDWFKDLAPSNTLRKQYHAGEATFAEFRAAYLEELSGLESEQLNSVLAKLGAGETVTLLYAAKNEDQNHAIVLAEFLSSLG